ncbi:MAG: hypothetical protein J0H07_14265 [Sphingobacteriales bacterium]|nr:hypothetical protein [Sphingobacteriales bacterium]
MNTVVRYKVWPERVAENEELVRAVYRQLHALRPAGAKDRCEEAPQAIEASVVGNFGFL